MKRPTYLPVPFPAAAAVCLILCLVCGPAVPVREAAAEESLMDISSDVFAAEESPSHDDPFFTDSFQSGDAQDGISQVETETPAVESDASAFSGDPTASEAPADGAASAVLPTEGAAMETLTSSDSGTIPADGAVPEEVTSPSDEIAQPTETLSGVCTDQITWEVTADGSLILTGSGDLCDYTEEAPAPWHELSDRILSITVSEGVTGIGDYAFDSFSRVTRIQLPDSLTGIGAYAFHGMTGLESLSLDLSRTRLDTYALNGCSADLVITLGSASVSTQNGGAL